jgi:hypothetical protein
MMNERNISLFCVHKHERKETYFITHKKSFIVCKMYKHTHTFLLFSFRTEENWCWWKGNKSHNFLLLPFLCKHIYFILDERLLLLLCSLIKLVIFLSSAYNNIIIVIIFVHLLFVNKKVWGIKRRKKQKTIICFVKSFLLQVDSSAFGHIHILFFFVCPSSVKRINLLPIFKRRAKGILFYFVLISVKLTSYWHGKDIFKASKLYEFALMLTSWSEIKIVRRKAE